MTDAIYIHIPFCLKKCNYCDFLSFQNKENLNKYIEYLIKEIKLYSNYEFDTIYLGGGTPSILDIKSIDQIIKSLRKNFNTEITLEVNPKTVDLEKLTKLKEIGINRLSIGVQSFNDNILKTLGRVHDSKEALKIIDDIKKIGFENFSLDLIFGIPGQTLEMLKEDLEKIKEINPNHVSIYSLIWEEGTKFWDMRNKGLIKEIDEDIEADMFEEVINFLKNNDYIHYEISNFAKLGKESRHNLKYWRNQTYVGVGLGASGYLGNERYKNVINFEDYFNLIDENKKPILEIDIIDENTYIENKYMLGLRLLKEGVEIDNKEYQKKAENLVMKGFLHKTKENRYYLSEKGLFIANEIFMEFIA